MHLPHLPTSMHPLAHRSALTNIYGVTEEGHGKVVRRDDRARPAATIFDPKLASTLPHASAITSAWNACAHAIGALNARAHAIGARNACAHAIGALACAGVSPLVHRKAEDGLSSIVEGFRLLLELESNKNSNAKSDTIHPAAVPALQYGAFLCGSVLHECTMGVHHKVAHICGGTFGMEHSSTHTALLPFTTAYNLHAAPQMAAALGRVFKDTANPAGAMWDLQKKQGVPTNIRSLGFRFESLDEVARAVEVHAQKAGYANPRPVVAKDIADMLSMAHHGRRPSGGRVRLDR